MASTARTVHSLGLSFGLYMDAGTRTCAGFPGSLGYEREDAQSFAGWGVDYVKVDNCYNQGVPSERRYTVMRDALNATGRPMFISMCNWGCEHSYEWGAETGNSWRTGSDLVPTMPNILRIAEMNAALWRYAGPGGWNDPDLLAVGNGALTAAEEQTHFSLWLLMKAPLMISAHVRSLSNATRAMLQNPVAISIHQDPLAIQGYRVRRVGDMVDLWACPLSGGRVAAVVVNTGDSGASATIRCEDIGFAPRATARVTDVFGNRTVNTTRCDFEVVVEPNSSLMLLVSGKTWAAHHPPPDPSLSPNMQRQGCPRKIPPQEAVTIATLVCAVTVGGAVGMARLLRAGPVEYIAVQGELELVV